MKCDELLKLLKNQDGKKCVRKDLIRYYKKKVYLVLSYYHFTVGKKFQQEPVIEF